MPLVSQKGELVAEMGVVPAMVSMGLVEEGLETGSIPNFFPYQAACSYAITDHWAVQIASRNSISTRHQAMVGWYNPLSDNATVEVYGGYAYSVCSSGNMAELPYTRQWGDAHTLFLQGDIGIPSYKLSWDPRTSVSCGFGLRVGGLRMNYQEERHEQVYDPENDSYSSEVSTLPGVNHVTTLEVMPMIQLGIGGEHFKFELGIGHSFTPSKVQHLTLPLTLNASLTYRLPLLKPRD